MPGRYGIPLRPLAFILLLGLAAGAAVLYCLLPPAGFTGRP